MRCCRTQRVVGLCFFLWLGCRDALCLEITSIDFKGTADPSEIIVLADGPLTFDKQENPQDKQIVLEFKGATLSKNNARKIDTSSFNSKVSLISPYQVAGQEAAVRLVIQLRDFVPAEVTQDGNTLQIKIPSAVPVAAPPSDPATQVNHTTAEPQVKSKLDEFIDAQGSGQYTGKPITLQLRDADLMDVFRLIGEASGFNIIVGDDVKGKVTLSLISVPWDQALNVVLNSSHLGAERSGSVLRIATLASLTQEKVDQLNAKNAVEANTPQVTKVFSINYANLSDLQKILTNFATIPKSVGSSSGSAASSTSIVQLDNRTNSIIVRDFPDNIQRMKTLVEILDTQTPEVLIEAKIVEATESFSNDINGGFGVGGAGSASFFASLNGGNPLEPLLSATTPGAGIAAGSTAPNPVSGSFGFSPDVSFIPGVQQLSALLKLAEVQQQAKVVTSPRTVVLNKQKATIVESQPVLVPVPSTLVPGGSVSSGSAVQQANISLSVTPTVTNDGSVQLDLSVVRDVPVPLGNGLTGIGNRSLSTLVLVESGTTLVIGGIYTLSTSHIDEGIPFLRKIPILGALFGHVADQTQRTELFIFITPKIINMKEAGLNS